MKKNFMRSGYSLIGKVIPNPQERVDYHKKIA